MAGTKIGGMKAAATNKAKHGSDFYAKIGAKGGKKGHTGGFAAGSEGRERARKWGAIGGQIIARNREQGGAEISILIPISVDAGDQSLHRRHDHRRERA